MILAWYSLTTKVFLMILKLNNGAVHEYHYNPDLNLEEAKRILSLYTKKFSCGKQPCVRLVILDNMAETCSML